MAIDLTALKDELANDPSGIGYTGDDAADAELLNETPRSGTSVTRETIPTDEIRRAVVPAEWPSSNADAPVRDLLLFHTQGEQINPNDPNVRQAFLDAFPAGTTTRQNLAALQTREGSRAEELFGEEGVSVTPSDVANARRS